MGESAVIPLPSIKMLSNVSFLKFKLQFPNQLTKVF